MTKKRKRPYRYRPAKGLPPLPPEAEFYRQMAAR
jgi:hypothetical protein